MEYKSENRICQNCKNDFVIEPDDFGFYEKIKVPPPTFCPECRQIRRYAWRNERTFYRHNCDSCGKSKVSVLSSNKPYKVYCSECWWGDQWDATEYGQDFDFNRPFFEQYNELLKKVPRQSLLVKSSVNSDYTHHSSDNKNCYYCFSIYSSENILYSTNIYYNMRDSADCYHVTDGFNERHYECVDIFSSYQCQYSFFLKDCTNCYYSYDLRNCSNCFLSTNLRSKSYVFLNKQHSREEYLEKVKNFDLGSNEVRQKLHNEFLNLLKTKAIHKYIFTTQAIGCTGNFIANCKNSLNVFDANDLENCKNMYVALDVKDSAETYHVGFKTELCYEVHAVIRSYNVRFSNLSYDDRDIEYCDSCHNSSDLFGCAGVKKGSYMIFNKKYSKEDYASLKEKIIEHMKSTGEYGEFFPPNLSPYGYNETQGQVYMPLEKNEALSMGMKWEEATPGIYGKETINNSDVPDNIINVSDSITKEVLRCDDCTKNYNIAPQELIFYKKELIPIPRSCPDCRYKKRIALRQVRKLWHRTCMCDKSHPNHEGKCEAEFETSYAPDRPEIVYCERCYQAEIY